jgi:putative transposase
MDEYESLSHTKWECKYHVVFIPKCRRKTLYSQSRKHRGVHMMIAIPPKCAVSRVIGYIKGKSAIHLARVYGERRRSFVGQRFWARGYFVSRVGRDEAVIRANIQPQEEEDKRLDQLKLGF